MNGYCRAAMLLLILLFLGATASAVSLKSGDGGDEDDDSTDLSENEATEDESTEFVGEGVNFGDLADLEDAANKLFTNVTTFGSLSEGTFKLTSLQGWVENDEAKDLGLNALSEEFWKSDECWEKESDRDGFLLENERVRDGEPTTLFYHSKQIDRFLSYIAEQENSDGPWLPEGVSLVLLQGTVYMQSETTGQIYNIPFLGATSYKRDETGEVWCPSLDVGKVGFDNKLFPAPMNIDPTSDVVGWSIPIENSD